MKKLHVWSPGMFEHRGGIEAYSTAVFHAAGEAVGPERVCAYVKNDRTAILRSHLPLSRCCFGTGAAPLRLRTAAFAALLAARATFEKPDLIITTHLNFGPMAVALKKQWGIPFWIVAHGVEAWTANGRLAECLKRADRVIAVSGHTREVMISGLGLPAEKIVVLPNTMDEKRFVIKPKSAALLRRYGLGPRTPVVLTVARLCGSEQHKGYDRIIRALPAVKARIPDVHYLLAGSGDDTARIQALIVALKLQKSVTLTGFVSDDELCDHYNLCDVFAMLSKWEGFGIVFLEALACGKPVLAGNRDGSVDALCHGELGILIDPFDIESIASNLVELLRRTSSHPMVYDPVSLREKVVAVYGYNTFKAKLASYIAEFVLRQNDGRIH